jgi:hypothetical protein
MFRVEWLQVALACTFTSFALITNSSRDLDLQCGENELCN